MSLTSVDLIFNYCGAVAICDQLSSAQTNTCLLFQSYIIAVCASFSYQNLWFYAQIQKWS